MSTMKTVLTLGIAGGSANDKDKDGKVILLPHIHITLFTFFLLNLNLDHFRKIFRNMQLIIIGYKASSRTIHKQLVMLS